MDNFYESVLAEVYDFIPLYRDRADVPFYLQLAREAAGDVLELGCGTGRVLITLAEAGTRITGLDVSPAMLARCREKVATLPADVRQRIRLVQSSMTDFTMDAQFALVTAPFRAFQHLVEVDEQMACLRAVHRHLAPGGRVVLDMFQVNPAATYDVSWQQEREDTPEITLPDGRRFRRTHRVVAFHRARQCNEIEFIHYFAHSDGRTERQTTTGLIRYFYPLEVEHLLARCGFRVAAVYGNYDRSPFSDDSPEMIFVGAKATTA